MDERISPGGHAHRYLRRCLLVVHVRHRRVNGQFSVPSARQSLHSVERFLCIGFLCIRFLSLSLRENHRGEQHQNSQLGKSKRFHDWLLKNSFVALRSIPGNGSISASHFSVLSTVILVYNTM